MTRVRLLGFAALVLAGPALLGGCGEEDAPGAGPRAEPVAMREAPSGTEASVLLPTGRLRLVVGDPLARVPAEDTASLEAVAPVEGGSVVPVGLSFDAAEAPWHRRLAFPAVEATVRLMVEGRSYDVGAPYSVGDGDTLAAAPEPGWFVPVRDDVELADIEVLVGYDGAEQRVDPASGSVDPGPAAGLSALPRTAQAVPCPAEGWRVAPPVEVDVDCSISAAVRTPYWPGVGWAEAGSQWWVVSVDEVRVLRASRGGASYRVVSIDDRSTLAGAAPRQPLVQQQAPRDYVAAGVLVFPAAEGAARLHLELEVGLELDDPGVTTGAPDRLVVAVERSVSLSRLAS